MALLPDTLLTLSKLDLFRGRDVFFSWHLKLPDKIEIDFDGLRGIRPAFIVTLMNKNLVNKLIQHRVGQLFKVLIIKAK